MKFDGGKRMYIEEYVIQLDGTELRLRNAREEDAEMLIDYFKKQDAPITECDESAFEFLIEKIVVISKNELEFHVIGSLKFTEKIC